MTSLAEQHVGLPAEVSFESAGLPVPRLKAEARIGNRVQAEGHLWSALSS